MNGPSLWGSGRELGCFVLLPSVLWQVELRDEIGYLAEEVCKQKMGDAARILPIPSSKTQGDFQNRSLPSRDECKAWCIARRLDHRVALYEVCPLIFPYPLGTVHNHSNISDALPCAVLYTPVTVL